MAKPVRWFLLTWCAYVLFALLTTWDDFGARASPDDYLTWTVTRISTVTFWLLLAFLLLRDCQYRFDRDCFIYAAASTVIVAGALAIGLVSNDFNYLAVAGMVVFYGLVSGFLCSRLRKPIVAGFVGVLLFAVQAIVDAAAHLGTGVFRIH